jgi:hypothetical protein
MLVLRAPLAVYKGGGGGGAAGDRVTLYRFSYLVYRRDADTTSTESEDGLVRSKHVALKNSLIVNRVKGIVVFDGIFALYTCCVLRISAGTVL